jgi:hypothetical protein
MDDIHKAVGKILLDLSIPGTEVMLDSACGGPTTVPFYGLDHGEGSDHIVEVDAAIVFKNEIKVVVEIDASDLRPVALCGKVLATAISNHFRLGKVSIPLSDSLLFIQVVQHSADKTNTSKLRQCKYMAREIKKCLVAAKNRITEYSFHYATTEDFAAEARHAHEIRQEITSFLTIAECDLSASNGLGTEGCDPKRR